MNITFYSDKLLCIQDDIRIAERLDAAIAEIDRQFDTVDDVKEALDLIFLEAEKAKMRCCILYHAATLLELMGFCDTATEELSSKLIKERFAELQRCLSELEAHCSDIILFSTDQDDPSNK